MVRSISLPLLAACLLALTAQAQPTPKKKPAPAKETAVQPFTPSTGTAEPEVSLSEQPALPATVPENQPSDKPAAVTAAPAKPIKPAAKPAKQ